MTAPNMPCHTKTNSRDTVSREQADCSNWKPPSFTIIIFVCAQPFINCLSVIELIEGCANRSNAFCWVWHNWMCQTDVCPVSSYNTMKQQQNVYRRFMVLPTDSFFVCARTHTHTHTLVLAHKTGYHWKCYLTGYSIVYLLVWESRHPQLCLVIYITCSQNGWSIYFCLYCITLAFELQNVMTSTFGLRMLSKH